MKSSNGVALILICMLLLSAACGGSSSNTIVPGGKTTITGSVFAAPVAGATVVVLNSSGTTTLAGPVTTGVDGSYSVDIPTAALKKDLVISSSTGTFSDEATAAETTAGAMSAYVEGGTLTAGSSVTLDPPSTITHKLVTAHGKTVAEAETAFGNGFGFMPDTSVAPELATMPCGTDGAPRHRGLVAAAISQLALDLGLTPEQQFDLLAALAEDLSDGKLDGMNGASAVTIPGTAITLPTDIMKKYLQALDNASRTAFTSTYQVEYGPGMMAAAQGKTKFTIKITKRSDGSLQPGLMLSLMPMMHMLTMDHSAPVDDELVDNGDGTYSCTIYYLMPGAMNGMALGYWELKVAIGSGMMGEAAMFYPYVGMAMGDTASATLYGPGDLFSGMTGTENRKYYLFKESVISAATPTLNLYIAHDAGMKMSFEPAFGGAVLGDPVGTVTSMTVRASTDKSTWSASNVDMADGHWSLSLSGLGLSSGVTTTVYVELNVNSEQKTTNGAAVSGTNDYASFKVTPQP